MFRICRACGKLDSSAGVSTPREHRAWCPHRRDPDEHTRELALSRELITQGVALSLPEVIAHDLHSTDSLSAAVLLGLRETMGGAPDHLRIAVVPQPAGGDAGQVRTALFLHDTVPGGTGYLTELADPARLWAILVRAAQVLQNCLCQEEGRASCHRCLLPFVRRADQAHRIDALRALQRLLGIDDEVTVSDLEPDLCLWDVRNEPVSPGSGESPLEQRFRTLMAERLAHVASVKSKPGPRGTEMIIRSTDDRVWHLRPQVDLHGSRPDFVLETSGGAKVAIFTDGWSFHASPANNRIADDAAKRETLRAHGYHVVSVTHDDLEGTSVPAWLNDAVIGLLMQQRAGQLGAGISRESAQEHRDGPLGLLDGFISRPEDTARTHLANAVGLLLAVQAGQEAKRALDPGVDLLDAAEGTLAGTWTWPRGGDDVIEYRRPHLVFLARMRGGQPVEMVLVLDDSQEAVQEPDHKDVWREWLRLSNLLDQADVPARITTRSLIGEGTAGAPRPAPEAGEAWPGVDLEDLDPEVIELAGMLADRGVAPAAVGDELDGGVVAELSWGDPRVAVVYDEMPDDEVAVLQQARWQVLRADADAESVADGVMSAMTNDGEE